MAPLTLTDPLTSIRRSGSDPSPDRSVGLARFVYLGVE